MPSNDLLSEDAVKQLRRQRVNQRIEQRLSELGLGGCSYRRGLAKEFHELPVFPNLKLAHRNYGLVIPKLTDWQGVLVMDAEGKDHYVASKELFDEALLQQAEDYHSDDVTMLFGDFEKRVKDIQQKQDFVLTGPVYDTTGLFWDKFPKGKRVSVKEHGEIANMGLAKLMLCCRNWWALYEEYVCKPGTCLIFQSKGRLTAALCASAPKRFKHFTTVNWNKPNAATRRKDRFRDTIEDLVVFYYEKRRACVKCQGACKGCDWCGETGYAWHPQKPQGNSYSGWENRSSFCGDSTAGEGEWSKHEGNETGEMVPLDKVFCQTDRSSAILHVECEGYHILVPPTWGIKHQTSTAVALGEWALRTLGEPGDSVLDNFMGCATFLVSARNLDMKVTGIEMDPIFFNAGKRRVLATAPGSNTEYAEECVLTNKLSQPAATVVLEGEARRLEQNSRERVLAFLGRYPEGVSVAELAREAVYDVRYVGSCLRQFEEEGRAEERDKKLWFAKAAPIFIAAPVSVVDSDDEDEENENAAAAAAGD